MPTLVSLKLPSGFLGKRMPIRARFLACFTLLTSLALAPAVFADPLLVTSGFAGIDFQDEENFHLAGHAFVLEGFSHGAGQALNQCNPWLQPCVPGKIVNLSALSVDPGQHVTENWAEINGTHYEPLYYSGSMDFRAGAAVIPDLAVGAVALLTAPFTFTAHIAGFDNFALAGAPMFVVDLSGGGTAMMDVTNSPEFGLMARRITYEFSKGAPTPEPASLMLLGSALGGLALRRWRRRR